MEHGDEYKQDEVPIKILSIPARHVFNPGAQARDPKPEHGFANLGVRTLPRMANSSSVL